MPNAFQPEDETSRNSKTEFAFEGNTALRVKMCDDALRFCHYFDARMRVFAVPGQVATETVKQPPLTEEERLTYWTVLEWVRAHFGSIAQGHGKPIVVLAPKVDVRNDPLFRAMFGPPPDDPPGDKGPGVGAKK